MYKDQLKICVLWAKANLFSSTINTLLTVICLVIVWNTVIPLVNWLVFDAYWVGNSPEDCPNKSAACWPFIKGRFDQFIYGLYPVAERWRINIGISIAMVLAIPLFIPQFPKKQLVFIFLLTMMPIIGVVFFLGGVFGLEFVPTAKWGGFFLTIITAVVVLTTSLPTAILLALGRESKIPLIKILCATWIEFWRSIPVLVVLFIAIIMFPLFMPKGIEIDKLLRALIALAILMSCYLAEAIRGALQSIPAGQYEAADALGLNYIKKTFFVILPQAIPVALPQITGNFIGLFKETTVLLIIGLYDLLGMVQNATADPEWLSQGVSATGYIFVAFFFLGFLFLPFTLQQLFGAKNRNNQSLSYSYFGRPLISILKKGEKNMVIRLANVCIETCDFLGTEDFYAHLGINRQLEFRNEQNKLVGVYLRIGKDSFIEIIKVLNPRIGGNIRHFAIEVEDVETTRDLLMSKGVEVTEKKMGVDHTLTMTCQDPNGNIVEFNQYTDKSLQLKGGVCEIDYTPM